MTCWFCRWLAWWMFGQALSFFFFFAVIAWLNLISASALSRNSLGVANVLMSNGLLPNLSLVEPGLWVSDAACFASFYLIVYIVTAINIVRHNSAHQSRYFTYSYGLFCHTSDPGGFEQPQVSEVMLLAGALKTFFSTGEGMCHIYQIVITRLNKIVWWSTNTYKHSVTA